MVNSVGALRSLTRLGVTFLEGVGELMDNAIDAHAKRVLLLLEVDRATGRLRMVVVDDGVHPTQVEGAACRRRYALRLLKMSPGRPSGRPLRFGNESNRHLLDLDRGIPVEGGQWRSCYYDLKNRERCGPS